MAQIDQLVRRSINNKRRSDEQLEIDQEQKPGKQIEDKEPQPLSTAARRATGREARQWTTDLTLFGAREQGPELRNMLHFGHP